MAEHLPVVAGVLAGLLAVALVALVLIASAARTIAREVRRLHLQQGNIIGMLLRAGFRPGRGGSDWFDDDRATRIAGESDDTQYDWKPPSD